LLFADDLKVILRSQDANGQGVLDAISQRVKDVILGLNTAKSHLMHIGPGEPAPLTLISPSRTQTPLDRVNSVKDFGIIFNSTLTPGDQVQIAVLQALQRIFLARRNFVNITLYIFRNTFSTIARPLLENCLQAWTSWLRRDINAIEGVLRLATRMVVGLSQLPYHERLHRLGTFSMERRMLRGDLIEVFRMFNGNTRVNPWDFFDPLPEGMERRRHPWAIYKSRANTESRRRLFV